MANTFLTEHSMRFLNPKTGFVFKKILGSEESGGILMGVLNVVLDSMYTQILDAYPAPKMKGIKDSCQSKSPLD